MELSKGTSNHPNSKKRGDVVVGVGGFRDSGGGGGGFGYTSRGGEVEMTKVVASVRGDSKGGVGDVRCGGDEAEMVVSMWRGRRWCGDGSEGGGVSAEDGGRRQWLAGIWLDVGGGAEKERKQERECVCAMIMKKMK
ncbi:hypothetical protein Tco_1296062 [Tanacetum coccineum]